MTENEVRQRLEAHEVPYRGWHNDWPDLYDEYFKRLSPIQQFIVNEFNAMSPAQFEEFKQHV